MLSGLKKWYWSQLKLNLLWQITFESERRCPCWCRWTCPTWKYHGEFQKLSLEAERRLHDLQTLKLLRWQPFLAPAHWHLQEAILSELDWQLGFGKGKTGPLLLVRNKNYLRKHSQSCDCFGIFIAWRQLGHSLITQTAALEWMIDSRTPMVHVL